LGHVGWGLAQQGRQVGAEIGVAEPVGQQTEHDQGREQGLGSGGVERQGGRALRTDDHRVGEGAEGALTDARVSDETFDVEQTSVGLVADLRQSGQVAQPFAQVEVTAVVDGRLGA
jgi:hypothetical protein